MSYTDMIAEFALIPREKIPASALAAGRNLIQDTLAASIGGHAVPSSEIVRKVVTQLGGTPTSTVLVSGERLSATMATYVNSHMANSIDAEETIHYKAHVSAATVAPALAVAEQEGSSGLELLGAVIVGFDVAARLSMSLKGLTATPDGGFQFAKITGYSATAFAATVGAGRLLGLTKEQMVNAIGITAASTSVPASSKWGLNLPRPMTKVAMYGTLGEVGVMAALLAKEGFTGEVDALDGDRGFWAAAGSLESNWDALSDRLGERWLVEEIIYKAYPACRFLCSPVDMFYELQAEHGFSAGEVESIEARILGPALAKGMADPEVESMVDGCFSLPYLLSCAAYAGPAGPGWHTPEARANEQMKAFARRVSVSIEPDAAPVMAEDLTRDGYNSRMPASIRITVGGRTLEKRTVYSKGDPYDPAYAFTAADHERKFRNYCAPFLPEENITAALEILGRLDQEPSIEPLMSALVATPVREQVGATL
ncbi:MmgE/PrpD family protein [Georgenia sp. AZ-5]|uniref:MmgE/PrpD family protein n=1 Tax=Georgenia sp. AZ-5 TaxID=3367526 RepID=UPI00375538FE